MIVGWINLLVRMRIQWLEGDMLYSAPSDKRSPGFPGTVIRIVIIPIYAGD